MNASFNVDQFKELSQKQETTTSNSMRQLRKLAMSNPNLCDCSFKCGGSVFSANRALLSMNSEVFEAMFYSDLKETQFPIVLTDVDPESFQSMLSYIYGQKVTLQSVTHAIGVFYVARKYQLLELEEGVEQFLRQNASPKDVFKLYELAKLFDLRQLLYGCKDFFEEWTTEVLEDSDFYEATLESIEAFLSLNRLNVESEVTLIESFNRYVKRHGLIRTETHPNPEMDKVIRYFRFYTIAIGSLRSLLEDIEWLTDSEKYLILNNNLAIQNTDAVANYWIFSPKTVSRESTTNGEEEDSDETTTDDSESEYRDFLEDSISDLASVRTAVASPMGNSFGNSSSTEEDE